jgi:5-hydroxyisourate hydrolase
MARLSTHVLDTARGVPAANVAVDVHLIVDGERRHVTSATTGEDGRTPSPLITGDRIAPGIYELTFHAAEYFQSAGIAMASPPFVGDVVIRFGVADPAGHYHVPLLLSPYGYTTYRGS